MTNKLRKLIERIEDWPKAAQAEAIASLETIEGYVGLYEMSLDDHAALERTEDKAWFGRSVADKYVEGSPGRRHHT